MYAARKLRALDESSFSAVKSIKASEICHSEFEASDDDMFGPSDTDLPTEYSPKPKRSRMSHSVVADNPCDTVQLEDIDAGSPHTRRFEFGSSKIARNSKKCPLCGEKVIHLPQHLRSKRHGWNAVDARAAVSRFGLRKLYTYRSEETSSRNKRHDLSDEAANKFTKPHKDYHVPKQCQYPGCRSVVKRLSAHLIKVHRLERGSPLLKHYLRRGKRISLVEGISHSHADSFNDVDLSDMDIEGSDADEATCHERPIAFDRGAHTDVNRLDIIGCAKDRSSELDECIQSETTSQLHETVSDNRDLRVADDCNADDCNANECQTVVNCDTRSDNTQNSGCSQPREPLGSEFHYDPHQFLKWLMSPDGGRKDKRSAEQHCRQVNTILGQVGNKACNLLDKRSILDNFLETYVKEHQYKAGTVQSHLFSLRQLYDHWLLDGCHMAYTPQITHMKNTAKRWIHAYQKDVNQRTLQKMDSDLQKIITADEIVQFSTSEAATTAIKILGRAAAGSDMPLSKLEYISVRDYLLAEIITRNAHRPGVLSEMRIKHVEEAKLLQDHYILSIPCHKTSSVHGPAKVILTQTVYRWLSVFVHNILPFAGSTKSSKCDLVFLSFSGEAMDSSHIGRAFQAIWKKSGLRDDVTCTLFRKSAVSKIHQQCPSMKGNLADLMCHRQETANKFYRVVDRSETSLRASMKLTELMTRSSHTDSPADDDLAVSEPLGLSQIRTVVADPHPPRSTLADTAESFVSDTQYKSITESSRTGSAVNFTISAGHNHREKMFSEAEISILVKSCREIISGRKPLSRDSIVQEISAHSDGHLLIERYSISQLMTRLTYERRKLKSA